MIVAIDGPAGSGKSTIARALARERGLTYLDTGAMYRCATLRCLQRGVDLADREAVARVAEACGIGFGTAEDGSQTVFESGEDVSAQIRSAEVDHNVSAVAAVPAVRAAMVARQRELGRSGNVVAEGRDIGTVVFPQADVKVFLTADPAARAHRRAVQRAGGNSTTDASAQADGEEERKILEDIVRRDRLDSSREESPLRPAEDAVHIDSSSLSVEEEVALISALMDRVASGERDSGDDVPAASQAASGGGAGTVGVPAADSMPAGTPVPNPEPDAAARRPAAEPGEGRMRAFAGNSFDDYYDHRMADFPLPARALLALAVCLVGALTKLVWPWKMVDGRKLWDERRGRVIVMNHVSMLDPIPVVVSLWAHGQRVRPVYKSEFDGNRFVTWLFSRIGGIPVVRGTADMSFVRRCVRSLRRGECILIFPEGTRVRSQDQPVELHAGFALVAQLAKAPVQPLSIVGALNITPEGTHWKRPGRVWCKVGDCLEFGDLGVRGRKAQAKAMESLAMDRVYAMRDELRREHPGKL